MGIVPHMQLCRMKAVLTFAPLLIAACSALPPALEPTVPGVPAVPSIAYHQHLISPATAVLIKQPEIDGAALVRSLDEAGIGRGVVLSMGYTYADERKKVADPDRGVRLENDWTANQVARSRGRLIGFAASTHCARPRWRRSTAARACPACAGSSSTSATAA